MNNKICSVENCNTKAITKGFCDKHYRRFKIYGDPLKTKYNMDHGNKCSVDGCNEEYYTFGYCSSHYRKHNKHGDSLYVNPLFHDMRYTPEYRVWINMKQRCFNPNHNSYDRYGGRGITVCDEWKNDFMAFFNDMGSRPFHKAQLDRRKNELGYNKDNCRWVTPTVNSQNKSNIKLMANDIIEIRASNLSRKELAIKYEVSQQSISRIIKKQRWSNV